LPRLPEHRRGPLPPGRVPPRVRTDPGGPPTPVAAPRGLPAEPVRGGEQEADGDVVRPPSAVPRARHPAAGQSHPAGRQHLGTARRSRGESTLPCPVPPAAKLKCHLRICKKTLD